MPSGRLDALLADLGPELRRGSALPSARANAPAPRRASGLPAIDALCGGGIPADRLTEITGPLSSGRTSVALALIARTTAAGELAAVVDPADAFDPASAEVAGADLDRVLWVRTGGGWREALRAVERLLETEGIPLVVLDASGPAPSSLRAGPPAAWTRLARLCAGTRSALVVLSEQRLTGPQAELVLALQGASPRFTGSPPLLEATRLRAAVVRRRGSAERDTRAAQEAS